MLARSSDPIQCHDAADRARQFAPSHRERILAALKKHGPRTAHELERITGLSVVQIDRRMHELVKAGEARAHEVGIRSPNGSTTTGPIRRQTPSGGWAQVWEAC